MADNNKKVPAAPNKKRGGMGEQKELGSFTAVVLVTCAFFALAFWGIDSGVLAMLRGILGINMQMRILG